MKICQNQGWDFADKEKGDFARVNLPHTVKLEPLDTFRNHQGIFVYRKKIEVPKLFNGVALLEFEGVMTNCKVLVDGKTVAQHFGGYLPFMVNLTEFFTETKRAITVEVEVNNQDDRQTPPGKPTSGLDFLYYGGIYRNVNLYLKQQSHLSVPFEPDVTDGGVRLTAHPLSNGEWNLYADIGVRNCSAKRELRVVVSVRDGDKELAVCDKKRHFARFEHYVVDCVAESLNVSAWNLNEPKLYQIDISLLGEDNSVLDQNIIEFGFRKAEITSAGLLINGNSVRLFGANRHQQYPYVGIAASDEAQRREARIFGLAGINCLRLAHYPQSEAFLSECGRLGIAVIDCVPGWQFLGGKVWKRRLKENVEHMVMRDRNQASVFIYEVTPNETMYVTRRGDNYMRELAATVKRLVPLALTAGDTGGRRDAEAVGFDIPYSGEDKLSAYRKLYANGEKQFLRREYGDWAFGGNNSTSRAKRGDGEYAMQVQAWNFQWTHNQNHNEPIIGDLIWEAIDHNRGYYPKQPISHSGALDIFRLPKILYGFLASQRMPKSAEDYVIFPAFTSVGGKTKLAFYANCTELELRINGKSVGRKLCDNGEDSPYDKKKNKEIDEFYWATSEDHITTSNKISVLAKHTQNCLFNGGNCRNMLYPTFTFSDISVKDGDTVTAVAYDGQANDMTSKTFKDAKKAVKLCVEVAEWGIPLRANDNDFVFVYVSALDDSNLLDLTFCSKVTLNVRGGQAIYTDCMEAEAGIASFLVKANRGEKEIVLSASTNDFTAEITVKTQVDE